MGSDVRVPQGSSPSGHDVAHATAGVGYIAVVARDDVNVQVEDCLSRGLSDVDADVKAIGGVELGDGLSGPVDRGHERGPLGLGGLEPGGNVAPRCEQKVARVDGKGIPDSAHPAIFEGDTLGLRVAERAIATGHREPLAARDVAREISS